MMNTVMRKTRFALLALLAIAVAVVIGGYRVTQKRNRMLAPPKPAPIPPAFHSTANNWSWSQSAKDRPVVEARARDFRQIKDSSRFELGEVELKIFSKTGDTFDLVRSQKAEFDQAAEKMYSEGEVTMVLGLPTNSLPEPEKRYVEIRTSGLSYDSKSGVSSTDRPVEFQFENGTGRSTASVYDPGKRYLWMKSAVEVDGAGSQAGMRIRAGELHYFEAEQKIELRPWSKLERPGQGVDAANSTVYLEKGNLKRIEALQGKGYDVSPGREVRFRGALLEVEFTSQQTVAKVTGNGDAQVVSRSATGVTQMTGERVDLEFSTPPGASESELSVAFVRGRARVESAPATAGNGPPAETKILTAEMIKTVLRPGGREVQSVATLSPGRLDFEPHQPGQWKRTLSAERLAVDYAADNRPETLRANGQVHLRSELSAPAKPQPPRLTWSDDLQASFDPQTGQMRELKQWSNFRYEEGARKARAGGARFDVANDQIALDKSVRVWDETSQTAADFLVLDQKQDRLHAEGHVTSTQQAARQAANTNLGGQPETLFSSDRPIHAIAERLDSEQRNQLLHYRGAARLWQDGNSIQAREIDLDRTEKTLHARGSVSSVLTEEEEAGKSGGPRLVSISADSLLYTDQDRRAYYTGRVLLRRERMTIRAAELEAFLRPQDETQRGESRLERALARGTVEILETAAEKHSPRRAAAEQAEYLSGEEKVTLRGGTPTLEQPGRGFTRGAELTYYIDNDRLLVTGRPGARTRTQQKMKRN
ncbi:MAG: LPS export ABC transporter periplasmic protein LptC [Acidobacteria bacterium]|nr:LPS export ABC transporter periplasmic protein LptC [Acidobacteriota bacterium]